MPALLVEKFAVVEVEHDENTGESRMLRHSFHDTKYDALAEIDRIRSHWCSYMIMQCWIENPEAK